MFRRPVRSATPDGAFFILRSIHFLTALLNSIAALRLAIPLLCPASLCHSVALLGPTIQSYSIAFPFKSIALPCVSVHCLCRAQRGEAFPLQDVAHRCTAVALLNDSRPFHCVAMQYDTVALHLVAPHCRCVTGFPPRQTGLFRCCATDRCRSSGHSPTIPGRPSRDRRRGRLPGTRK